MFSEVLNNLKRMSDILEVDGKMAQIGCITGILPALAAVISVGNMVGGVLTLDHNRFSNGVCGLIATPFLTVSGLFREPAILYVASNQPFNDYMESQTIVSIKRKRGEMRLKQLARR